MGPTRVLAVLFALAAAVPAAAAEPASPKADLSRVEKSLKEEQKRHEELKRKAEALSRDSQEVKRKMVRAAATVRRHEADLTRLEEKLRALQKQQRTLQAAIGRRGDQMVTVIAALQRLAWRPTEALIAQPTPPADTVRSAILLRSAVPTIEASARDLKGDLDKLSALRAQVKGQKDRIAAVTSDLAHTHDELKTLFADKATMQKETAQASEEAAARMQTLAREAGDLKELIAKLEAERARQREEARKRALERAKQSRTAAKPPPRIEPARPPKGFGTAQGTLPLPAVGEVAQKYGQITQAGIHAKGITIATRSRAQVISPFDGVVLFAGPFRGYGQLLIIEYGDGYHILLAGMNRIDAAAGQSLLAGEPVGTMADAASPELYVELRHDGQPINPLPWLTAGKGKGQG
ncbi:MAG: murein hydrolase activator EnvC [Rhodospirillaceae bacterium]